MSETKSLVPLEEVRDIAQAVAKSGLFNEFKNTDAAFALMMLCQAEGLHPMQAVRRYHIIQGRPAMKADAMLAEFQLRGGRVKWVRCDHDAVEAEFTSPGTDGTTKVTWSMEDAKRAGLAGKDNWRGYTRQMLRARVISEGVRMTMPEVVCGIYSPEEVQDFDTKPTYIPPAAQPAPVVPASKRLKIEMEAPPAGPKDQTSDANSASPSAPSAAVHPIVAAAEKTFGVQAEREPGSDDDDETPTDDGLVATYTWDDNADRWVAGPREPKRTNEQNAALHTLRLELFIPDDEWRGNMLESFNKDSSADLSVREASFVIDALKKRQAQKAKSGGRGRG